MQEEQFAWLMNDQTKLRSSKFTLGSNVYSVYLHYHPPHHHHLTPTTHKRLPLDTQLTYNTHIHAEFLSRGVCLPSTTGLNYLSWTLCSVSVARRDEMIFMEPLGQGWGRRRAAEKREATKTYMFVESTHNM